MFARINWGKIQARKWDEFESAFKVIVAEAGPQPGLKGRMLCRDINNPDTGFALSFWETEQDMRNYETSATMQNLVLPAIEPFLPGEYNTTFVEVLHNEVDM
jgi:heme-degrading monooxygenase HmoA